MEFSLIVFVVLLVVIGAVVYFAARPRAPEPEKAKSKEPPGRGQIPIRKASEKINVPEPVPVALDDGAGDIFGDRVLARTVDPSASEFKILHHAKLYAPGDTVEFYVKALTFPDADGIREPIPGLPVIVTNKAQARRLAGPVTTDANGEAVLRYNVRDLDMKGDMSTPEPDSGSWLCIAYIGGRLLNKVVPLWDVA